jgi:hypothetical protein
MSATAFYLIITEISKPDQSSKSKQLILLVILTAAVRL